MGTAGGGVITLSKTKIEWAESSWNPITGCTKISPGCRNCYAERMARRLAGRCGYPANNPFKVTLHPDRLEEPLKWKKPRRVFVCSMGDLFHEDVPDEFISSIFAIMWQADWHTFLILTKRPERMREFICEYLPQFISGEISSPHIWLGVTAENQQRADERIPLLLQTPAAVRFVSVEPLLGPLDLGKWIGPRMCYCGWRGYEWEEEDDPESDGETLCPNCGASSLYELGDVDTCCGYSDDYERHPIHWIIAGGESGHGARPCHPDWVRSLRDQCQDARVPFFLKQMHINGKLVKMPVLDGQVWDQMPVTAHD